MNCQPTHRTNNKHNSIKKSYYRIVFMNESEQPEKKLFFCCWIYQWMCERCRWIVSLLFFYVYACVNNMCVVYISSIIYWWNRWRSRKFTMIRRHIHLNPYMLISFLFFAVYGVCMYLHCVHSLWINGTE